MICEVLMLLMKFFISFLLCVSLIVSILFPVPLEAVNLEIDLRVKDIDNQPVSANKISLEFDGLSKDFKCNTIGNYSVKEKLNGNKIDSYEIYMDFGKPYLNRNIRFKEPSDNTVKLINIYKAQDDNYNYNYLQKGIEYLYIQPYDKALAHYEAAKKKYPLMTLDQYNVCLYYNYAIALANTYKYDNYDNYNLAINYLETLIKLYEEDNNKKYFAIEHISKDKLREDVKDLRNFKKKIKRTQFLNDYQLIQESFKKKEYEKTADLAESQLEICKNESELCKSTPLNEDRFLTDAGVSYLMAAEQAEKENLPKEKIREYLNAAKEALEKVQSLDLKTVKKNLQIIDSKLKSYQ